MKAQLLVVSAVLLWSFNALLLRYTSLSGVHFLFWSTVPAVLFFLVLLRKDLKQFLKKPLGIPIVVGIFGVINNVSFFMAYKLTDVATAVFVHYLTPVLVAVLAPFVLKEKFSLKVASAVGIALIGLFVMVKPQQGISMGVVLAFISAIAYAGTTLLFKKGSSSFKPYELAFSQNAVAVMGLLLWVLFHWQPLATTDLTLILISGIVLQSVGLVFFLKGMKQLPASQVSVITFLEPVGAVVLAIIFLKEIPTLSIFLGGALVLAACTLVITKTSKF